MTNATFVPGILLSLNLGEIHSKAISLNIQNYLFLFSGYSPRVRKTVTWFFSPVIEI
jgi:hypothetical protein